MQWKKIEESESIFFYYYRKRKYFCQMASIVRDNIVDRNDSATQLLISSIKEL